MAIITLTYVFSVGAVIISSQHNTNFSIIYSDYNGNITNDNIASAAGIGYTKLSLSNSIKNTDLLSTTVIGTSNGGTGSAANANANNGVVVLNSSRELPAVSGALLTNLTATLGSILNYGSSQSSSFTITQANIKICYGYTGSVAGNSSVDVTNLPFLSGTSYVVLLGNYSAFNMTVTSKTGTQFTLTNTHSDDVGSNGNADWLAIGV